MKKEWTVLEIEDLKALSVNYSNKELAGEFGTSSACISDKLSQLGLTNEYKYYSEDEKINIKNMILDGKSKKDIIKTINRSRDSFNNYLYRNYKTFNIKKIKEQLEKEK